MWKYGGRVRSVSTYMETCMYTPVATHTHIYCHLSVYVIKSVILPDYVAGLREAARHKEAFDDVDFLIHGLRRGEEIEIHRRRARRDRMQKDWGHQRVQTPCSTHSLNWKNEKHRSSSKWEGKETNCLRNVRQVTNYSKAEKSPSYLWSRQTNNSLTWLYAITLMFLFPLWNQYGEANRVKAIFSKACFTLMKMLFCGSPSSHSCWQFPSISWTRPLLSDWPAGTSCVGCYGNSRPLGPNLLFPAPLPWFCPIVALETRARW